MLFFAQRLPAIDAYQFCQWFYSRQFDISSWTWILFYNSKGDDTAVFILMFDDFERLAFVWGHAVPLIISLLCASGKKNNNNNKKTVRWNCEFCLRRSELKFDFHVFCAVCITQRSLFELKRMFQLLINRGLWRRRTRYNFSSSVLNLSYPFHLLLLLNCNCPKIYFVFRDP